MSSYQPMQNNPYGQGGWPGFPQPNPTPPRRSRKPLIFTILAFVAVIVIAAVIAIIVLPKGGSGNNGAAGQDQSPAKQNIIQQKPGQGAAPTYGSATLYDACALLPLSVLKDNNITLEPTASLDHDYFTRNIPSANAVKLPSLESASTCVYRVTDPAKAGNGRPLVISVLQSPATDVFHTASEFTSVNQHTASGLSVFVGEVQRTWIARIVGQNATVDVSPGEGDTILGRPTADVITKLADSAAAELVKPPTAPSVFSYDAPEQNVKQPCDVLNSATFKQYTNTDDWGLAKENLDVSEATLDTGNNTKLHYVHTNCVRQSAPPSGRVVGDKYIILDLYHYRDAASAKYEVEHSDCNAQTVNGIQAASNIGDGAACAGTEAGKPNLWFYVGNYVVSLSDQSKSTPANDLSQYIAAVTPLTKLLSANLGS